MKQFSTPILFNIFNRPEPTRKVLEAIRQQQPAKLYIHADGPRMGHPTDADNVEACKAIISELIDWPCDLQLFYETENKGCGHGPADAITWFFENEEQGIILEDDCLPHPDFFRFAEEMLERYKDDARITSIAGSNFQDGKKRGKASYYFSNHNRIWGWATWRRVWKQYDYYLSIETDQSICSLIDQYFSRGRDRKYWKRVLYNVQNNQLNDSCWDYQFMYLQWKLNGMTITPNVNLVSNIGDGSDATHTNWVNNPNLNRKVTSLYPIVYTDEVRISTAADNYYMDKYILYHKNIFQRICRKIIKCRL